MVHKENHHDNSFWIGLIVGGFIAIGLTVLFGSEKGKRLIKRLEEEGLDFLDDAKNSLSDTKQQVSQEVVMKVEELEEKGAELVEKGKALIDEGKHIEKQVIEQVVETKEELAQQAVETADAALAHIEQLQERGRQTTAELRKRLFKNIPKRNS